MLTAATQAVVDGIDALAEQDPHALPDGLLLEDTETLLAERRRLDGLIARRVQVIDARDATTEFYARSTKNWLVEDLHLSRADAGALTALARSSVTRPAILDAVVAGEASLDHAATIVGFLAKLPDPDARDHAEKLLLEAAKDTDPSTMAAGLRQLADHLCLDETAEQRAVRRHEGRYLTFTDTIDGMVRVDGMVDAPFGKILKKAVDALAGKAGDLDERTPGQRRADALVDLARSAMNRGALPDTAGEPTQATVLVPLTDLQRDLAPGETADATVDGTPITPNTARMLACDAGIIPAVLGGDSEILDLGRATRTWTRAQRKAAKIRAHGHCEAPRCQASIDRCDLHHEDHWAHGGRTDLANGIYLCTYHHWLVHHTHWVITRNKTTGQVEIRRT
jgi:hypothetical protein